MISTYACCCECDQVAADDVGVVVATLRQQKYYDERPEPTDTTTAKIEIFYFYKFN